MVRRDSGQNGGSVTGNGPYILSWSINASAALTHSMDYFFGLNTFSRGNRSIPSAFRKCCAVASMLMSMQILAYTFKLSDEKAFYLGALSRCCQFSPDLQLHWEFGFRLVQMCST